MTAVKQITISVLTVFLLWSFSKNIHAENLTTERKAQLKHMVKQDCGSCHGMTLKGGLGPELLPKNMKKLPIALIKNTILFGRPGTAMPPWKTILTEQEALWIGEQLQKGIDNNDQEK